MINENRKLVVLPNDSLKSLYDKGEIKTRYWNPENYFKEIHIISLSNEEISAEKVKTVAGDADLKIHSVGRPKIFEIPFYFKKIKKIIEQINPDIIKANNPSLMGALAVYSGRKLDIPVVVSIHSDYNPLHNLKILGSDYFPRIFRDVFSYLTFEPYTYRHSTKIIGAYNFAVREAKKYRRDLNIIYNKVFTSQFKPKDDYRSDGKIKIISVGRHIKGKNPENIIRAIEGLKEYELILVGQGPLTKYLKKLVSELNLDDRVEFISSVPNSEINNLYNKCDIFAMALEYGGVCIPEIEAMASGLPIVITQPIWEEKLELVDKFALKIENNSAGFKEAFDKLRNESLRQELGIEGRKLYETIEGGKLEEKEVEIYSKLIMGNS